MKPSRTFSANKGQYSTGNAGPDAIETDFDVVFKMFDPSVTHTDDSPGGIGSENLQNEAVTTAKLVDQGVTTAKVADGAITTEKIEEQGVTTAKVADGAITTAKVEDEAITKEKIKNYEVTAEKLAPEIMSSDVPLAVHRTAGILDHPDGSVTVDKLADEVKMMLSMGGMM